MDTNLESWLKEKDIKYVLHKHPAVFTVAEAKEHCSFISISSGFLINYSINSNMSLQELRMFYL